MAGGLTPENTKGWMQAFLPFAQQAGPFMTLAMAVILTISIWWMNGWLSECIDRNRLMATQLVSQQKEFHTEIMMRLAHCPPPR